MAANLQAYVDMDVTDNIKMTGFGRERCSLRYTPITISQEEVIPHMDPTAYNGRVNPQDDRPRYLENMFHPMHYPEHGNMKYQTRFAEKAKVVVGITMYQEPCGPPVSSHQQWRETAREAGTVCATLHAVAQNLQAFKHPPDGLTSFQEDQIVVVLTADGRTRIDGVEDNLKSLKSIGAYSEIEELYAENGPLARAGRLKSADLENRKRRDSEASRSFPKYSVDGGKAVMLHLFEAVIHYESYPSMQFMFCLKEFNAGKLDSHLWFFDMFASHFYRVNNPLYQNYFRDVRQQDDRDAIHEIYTVLLDAGTVPDQKAIVELVSCMEKDPKVAGCCGEITVDGNDQPCKMFWNWIMASQNFEYKNSNFQDKSMQSLLGYIEVLPGAFSAYRWTSLSPPEQHPTSTNRPLFKYFQSLIVAGEMHPFFENMYLAEDRILCYELVTRGKNRLHYIRHASARTDVPKTLAAFIKQRRRWLNGSQFAMYYAIGWGLFKGRLGAGNHSFPRKMFYFIEFLYLFFNSILWWFMIGNTFLFSYVFVRGVCLPQDAATPIPIEDFFQHQEWMVTVPIIFRNLYMALLLITLILALSNRPDTHYAPMRILYKFVAFMYGSITMILCVVMLVIMYESFMSGHSANVEVSVTQFKICASIASMLFLGSIFIGSVLHCEIHHILTCILQYTFVLPSLLNMVQVFAFCNLHDISWGTKGLDDNGGSSRQAVTDERNGFRSFMTILWLLTNGILVGFMICGHDVATEWGALWRWIETYYLTGIVCISGAMSALKLSMSTLYIFGEWRRRHCGRRQARSGMQMRLRDGVAP